MPSGALAPIRRLYAVHCRDVGRPAETSLECVCGALNPLPLQNESLVPRQFVRLHCFLS